MVKQLLKRSVCAALFLSILLTVFPLWPTSVDAARIKDIAAIKGIRKNQLTGYGLVIGLDGTGDSANTGFTNQALANMMRRMNINVDENQLQVGGRSPSAPERKGISRWAGLPTEPRRSGKFRSG